MTYRATRSVFLSYRREDTRHVAGRLADRLTERLGSTQVFMDVTTIEPGADFAAAIAREVAACDVLIALIGPAWLTVADQRGRRRLDDPDDIVVLEIQAALERGIRVIPVLVDGAAMPDQGDLPRGMQGLARRNAVRVDHETFHSDIATLLDVAEQILPTPTQNATEPIEGAGARVFDRAIDTEHVEQALDADNVRAVYQRAIDSSHRDLAVAGTVNLGLLLAMQGDVDGARTAYRRAINSGHAEWAPAASVCLGVLLAERGDIDGARTVYRRVIDGGHARWASAALVSLGRLLAEQGDIDGALGAYYQVSHAGWIATARKAEDVLDCAERGKPVSLEGVSGLANLALAAAVSLGLLLAEQGDVDGARVIYQRVIDSGYAPNYLDKEAVANLRRLRLFTQPGWRSLLKVLFTGFVKGKYE